MIDYQKITKKSYDKISKEWDSKRSYIWSPVKVFLESLEKKEKLKLLDLGCGTGRFLQLAQKQGFQNKNIIGYDYSTGQLNITKSKGFQTQIGDLINLPFLNSSFDVILCIAAHHHLLEKESQIKALKEMKRVLKPNGKILLSNWHPSKDFSITQEEKRKFVYLDKNRKKVKVTFTMDNKKYDRYYYMFEPEEIKILCKEAGFKILDTFQNRGNLYLTLN